MTACSEPRAERKMKRKGEQSFRPARGFRLPWQKDMGERPYEDLQEMQRRQKSGEEGVVARGFRMAQRLRGNREGDCPHEGSPAASFGRRPSSGEGHERKTADLIPPLLVGKSLFAIPLPGGLLRRSAPRRAKARVPRFPVFKRISKRRSIGRRRTHVASP